MSDTFPIDWIKWRKDWDRWSASSGLYRTKRRNPFKGKNFLADSVLGVYDAKDGRIVELSEVVFPNLSERDESGHLIRADYRYIGLTFDDGETALAASFPELEGLLGL